MYKISLPESGEIPAIPVDEYEPIYNHSPYMRGALDSMVPDMWIWTKEFIGFRGKNFGVVLTPEWADILEKAV